jgi:hypothetical protein
MNNQPETIAKGFYRHGWMFAVVLTGLAARWYCFTLGHNYDFDSYRVVADLMQQGKNVYANTDRYNYGPVWFQVIHILDMLAGHNENIFRWLILGFLSATDFGIFWVLWRKFGRLAAAFFFLNPISILITGYHNQFDNVAILLGIWSVSLYADDFEKDMHVRKLSALLLLGVSLMTKHLLFVFPLWLAVKQKGWWQKGLVLAVPAVIFILGFAPYWAGGKSGIIDHVFKYQSHFQGYLYGLLTPAWLESWVSAKAMWVAALVVFAFVWRRRPGLESLILYTAVLVGASPATTNQYLAIPVAFTAVFINLFSVLYTVIATYFICVSLHGPHLANQQPMFRGLEEMIAIYCLCFAVGWVTWRGISAARLDKKRRLLEIQSPHRESPAIQPLP